MFLSLSRVGVVSGTHPFPVSFVVSPLGLTPDTHGLTFVFTPSYSSAVHRVVFVFVGDDVVTIMTWLGQFANVSGCFSRGHGGNRTPCHRRMTLPQASAVCTRIIGHHLLLLTS